MQAGDDARSLRLKLKMKTIMKTILEPCHPGLGNGRTRSVLECGGLPPLFSAASGLHRAQSARGLAHSKTGRNLAALLFCFILLSSAFILRAAGQTYSIDWHKIAGGGGTSTGGVYAVSGTIGQHDASLQPMSGGNYSLTGGFWALISVVQTPGAPTLYISHADSAVTVYWQDVAGWNLVQSGNLAMPIASWPASGNPTLANGTNYLSIANPSGNLFFRLKNP